MMVPDPSCSGGYPPGVLAQLITLAKCVIFAPGTTAYRRTVVILVLVTVLIIAIHTGVILTTLAP